MQRSATARNNICSQILLSRRKMQTNINLRPYDVFISHRRIDTKNSVAGLLYNYLSRQLHLRPFLDSKNMKPGDKLLEKIDMAIGQCKIGIAVFSPRYCDSYFCLHELALMMEAKKKVIPVFCDVKPSQLRVNDDGICPARDLDSFSMALEEAKYTVGLTFDTLTGDWSEFLAKASDAVTKNLVEVEQEILRRKQKSLP
ncbi:disease resistance CSA1 [Olea europaea subsp. europaea]|uniref:Disease resistance CSA1 n=1 Tax=Olea europaea subsp. europaea TaxID=158383 RepID=A0A8S0UIC7_OLEEU|nr:disease resistance CSA1 [Olea europaea subsp. europaea]